MCDTRTTIADELTHKSRRKICLYYYCLVVRLVVDSYVYSNGSQPDVCGGYSQGHSFSSGSQGSWQTDSIREKRMAKKTQQKMSGRKVLGTGVVPLLLFSAVK
jgi:hypothetical protein